MAILFIFIITTALLVIAELIHPDLAYYFTALWAGYITTGALVLQRYTWSLPDRADKTILRLLTRHPILGMLQWPFLDVNRGSKIILFVSSIILALFLQWLAKLTTGYFIIGDVMLAIMTLPALREINIVWTEFRKAERNEHPRF